jgi:hypothetical protein
MMIQAVMVLAGLAATEPSHEVLTLSTGEKVVVTKQYADCLRQLKPLTLSLVKQLQRGGQEPRLSAPAGSEKAMKFVDQSIQWLQQQQPRGPLRNTERAVQAIQNAASEQPLSNTERFLQALREASEPLSSTERALRAFLMTASPKR